MVIESEARKYVIVQGTGKPIIRPDGPVSDEIARNQQEQERGMTEQEVRDVVESEMPDDTTLTRNAIALADQQGFTREGVIYEGQVIPYGRFNMKLSTGQTVVPKSYDNVVSVLVQDQKSQYQLQGSYYALQGYTPEQTPEGVRYVKTTPDVSGMLEGNLNSGYVPESGDVQQYPGGPIVNVPHKQGGLITSPEQHDFLTGVGQQVNDALNLILGGVPKQLAPGPTGASPFDVSTGMVQVARPGEIDPLTGRDRYQQLTEQGYIPLSQAQQEGYVTPSQALLGIMSLTQLPAFITPVSEFATILPKASAITTVYKYGTGVGYGLMGAGAVKGVAESEGPSQVYQAGLLGVALLGGAKVGGLKLSDLSYANLLSGARTIRDVIREGPLEQKPWGFKVIKEEDLIKGIWDTEGRFIQNRPKVNTRQTTLEEGRFYYNPETGSFDLAGYVKPRATDVLELKPKPTVYENRPMTVEEVLAKASRDAQKEFIERKPLEENKTEQTSVEDFITKIRLKDTTKPNKITDEIVFKPEEGKTLTLEEILTKVRDESFKEFRQKGKAETKPKQEKPLQITFDDLAKGRRFRLTTDEKGNVRVDELERMTNEELLKQLSSSEKIERKNMRPREVLEWKTEEKPIRETIIEVLKPETRIAKSIPIEEEITGVYPTMNTKLWNEIVRTEAGIVGSTHWSDIGPKAIREGRPVFGKIGPGSITKNDFGIIQFSGTGIKPIEVQLPEVMQNNINIESELMGQINKQNEQTRQRESQVLGERNIQIQFSETGQRQLQRDIQNQLSMQLPIQDIMLDMMSQTDKFQEENTNKRIIPIDLEGVIEEFTPPENQSFIIKIRGRQYRHGQKVGDDSFHRVSRPLSYDDAMSLMLDIVGNSEKATGMIEPSNEKPHAPPRKVEHWSNNIFKYREMKPNMWVEDSRFRMDSPGEISAITMKGLEAIRRMKI